MTSILSTSLRTDTVELSLMVNGPHGHVKINRYQMVFSWMMLHVPEHGHISDQNVKIIISYSVLATHQKKP